MSSFGKGMAKGSLGTCCLCALVWEEGDGKGALGLCVSGRVGGIGLCPPSLHLVSHCCACSGYHEKASPDSIASSLPRCSRGGQDLTKVELVSYFVLKFIVKIVF